MNSTQIGLNEFKRQNDSLKKNLNCMNRIGGVNNFQYQGCLKNVTMKVHEITGTNFSEIKMVKRVNK